MFPENEEEIDFFKQDNGFDDFDLVTKTRIKTIPKRTSFLLKKAIYK